MAAHGGSGQQGSDRLALLETAWHGRDVTPEQAAQTARAALKSPDGARADVILAYLDWRAGHYGRSAGRLGRAMPRLERGPGLPDVWLGRALNTLANLHSLLNQPGEAATLFGRQLQLARDLDSAELEASGLHDLGVSQFLVGDAVRAEAHLRRALPLLDGLSDPVGQGIARLNLGILNLRAGQPQVATEQLLRALATVWGGPEAEVARAPELPWLESRLRRSLLEAAEAAGDDRLVAEQETALRRLSTRAPDHLEIALDIALALSSRAGPQATLEQLRPVLDLARRLGQEQHAGLVCAHERLSEACAALGDPGAALDHLRAALALERATHAAEREQQYRALEVLHHTRVLNDIAEQERQKNSQLLSDLRDLQTLNEHMRRLSLTDGLTGLYNRYHLFLEGERLSARATPDRPLGVAIIDIDHFKRINDRCGHLPGDEVLRTLARLIRDFAQPGDLAARYGGEEFVLLRPGVSAPAFAADLQALRQAVTGFGWEAVAPGLRVTVSIGVAEACGPHFEAGLGAADQCLYLVKNTGRDAVRFCHSPECAPGPA
ncbi:diguanylate cyclase [uncultured Deinococcus sp.]|uniref:diguanylate cyclase n=1 Tax=uncultured Deinococcus sp. TaxID=158789 RepID=UPI00374A8B31